MASGLCMPHEFNRSSGRSTSRTVRVSCCRSIGKGRSPEMVLFKRASPRRLFCAGLVGLTIGTSMHGLGAELLQHPYFTVVFESKRRMPQCQINIEEEPLRAVCCWGYRESTAGSGILLLNREAEILLAVLKVKPLHLLSHQAEGDLQVAIMLFLWIELVIDLEAEPFGIRAGRVLGLIV